MNIINKIGIATSILAVSMMSSCSDKGYWDEAPLEQAYSFDNASYSASLTPGENVIELSISRTMSGSEESVNVTFTPGNDCPSDITVENPVVFAAGSATSTVKVKIANATPPYTYSGTLGFDGKVSYSGLANCTLKCPVEYTWTSIGNGSFYDGFVMAESGPFDVEILKADGFNRYRVMEPYKEYYASDAAAVDWENWISSTGPAYVEFWENSDNSLMFNAYASGLLYEATAGQPINVYPWNALSSGKEGFDVWAEPGVAYLSPIYYIPNVGGFGQQQYSVQITLPK